MVLAVPARGAGPECRRLVLGPQGPEWTTTPGIGALWSLRSSQWTRGRRITLSSMSDDAWSCRCDVVATEVCRWDPLCPLLVPSRVPP